MTADDAVDAVDEYRMPLLEHLKELRDRLVKVTVALGLAMAVSLFFATDIMEFLAAPVDDALIAQGIDGGLAMVKGPFEGIYTWLRAGLMGAFVLASPVVAWQIWGFVAPGLYKTERRLVLPLALSSTVMFLLGGAFTYVVVFPVAFQFLFTVLDVDISMSVEGYLSAVIKLMFGFGMSFQLPVAVFFMAKMGLIDHRDMMGGFRYAVVAIFVIAALMTPPDLYTQALLAIPLVGLYGVGIVVAWMFTTKTPPASTDS